MKCLKNPMTNAFYLALITAIYAAIFIASSEFTQHYEILLSDSQWASFIAHGNLKYVGMCMIGVAILIDVLSAFRRKKYDEYQTSILEKVLIFNGIFASLLFPLSAIMLVFAPTYFLEVVLALIVVQWVIIIITEVFYFLKNY